MTLEQRVTAKFSGAANVPGMTEESSKAVDALAARVASRYYRYLTTGHEKDMFEEINDVRESMGKGPLDEREFSYQLQAVAELERQLNAMSNGDYRLKVMLHGTSLTE